MQVHEVMSRQVETISPEATLREAARKMKDLGVGPLPVFDGRVVLGMLTDRESSSAPSPRGSIRHRRRSAT